MRRIIFTVCLLGGTTFSGCGESPKPKTAISDKPTTHASAPAVDNKPADVATVTKQAGDAKENATGDVAKVRKVTFQYRFRVKGLKPTGDVEKDIVRVWLPCPQNTDCQEIKRLTASAPGEISENGESKFGNRFLYFETQIPESGEFAVDVPYEVTRHEVLRKPGTKTDISTEKLDDIKRQIFLGADKMVPTGGKALTLLAAVDLSKDKLSLARQLYDIVDNHVVYKKEGTGWGRGDTNWVCDSGYGNCTDFHSLFMSLARSQGLPTRFEIGFSIPTDKTEGPIAGYHCWAWFYLDGRGWIPVDISEADKHPEMKEYYFGDLTADRVMFSTGRDLELVPKSDQPPLNFFINPHIEVGGKTLEKENVELQFAFEDRS